MSMKIISYYGSYEYPKGLKLFNLRIISLSWRMPYRPTNVSWITSGHFSWDFFATQRWKYSTLSARHTQGFLSLDVFLCDLIFRLIFMIGTSISQYMLLHNCPIMPYSNCELLKNKSSYSVKSTIESSALWMDFLRKKSFGNQHFRGN